MSNLITTFAAGDVLDITVNPARDVERGGRVFSAFCVGIKTMSDRWGETCSWRILVPAEYIENFWPVRNPISGAAEIPDAVWDATNNTLKPGTCLPQYFPKPVAEVPAVKLTRAQWAALRRAASGKLGNGTHANTLAALGSAGYLDRDRRVPTLAGIKALEALDS